MLDELTAIRTNDKQVSINESKNETRTFIGMYHSVNANESSEDEETKIEETTDMHVVASESDTSESDAIDDESINVIADHDDLIDSEMNDDLIDANGMVIPPAAQLLTAAQAAHFDLAVNWHMPLPPSHYHAMVYAEHSSGGMYIRSMNRLYANVRMRQARFVLHAILHWNGVEMPASHDVIQQLLAMSVASAVRYIISLG